ncbi:MAG: ABC transporter ATP-binding protein [Bacillus sp. (in: firmicutes)]
MLKETVLNVKDLKVSFSTDEGYLTAVDGVSFELNKGEVLGVVGESGCGKSVTSLSILRLLDRKKTKIDGDIQFNGQNLLELKERNLRKIRGNSISMVHQNPMSSLNPVYTIGNQLSETIRLHQKVSKSESMQKSIELLRLVGIPSPEEKIHSYPHQLSGGMKQRVMIALALACQPKILIADEPTTALDVTIQSQILELMHKLKEEMDMSVIFITHDLGVVAEFCTKVVVMYLGQVVESADVKSIFKSPLHPYTKGLLKSIPRIDGERNRQLFSIEGAVPSLQEIPKGCRFSNRCTYVTQKCLDKAPELKERSEGHYARCWL